MAPSYSGVWNISTQYQYRTGWPFDANLGSKALTAIGYDDTNSAYSNVVERFIFESAGNSTDFGDLSVARSELAGFGNDTRALFASGYTGSNSDVIDRCNLWTVLAKRMSFWANVVLSSSPPSPIVKYD